MRTLTFLTLALSLFVAGCGSKSKLTAEQKAEFTETLESAGRGQKVAQTSAKTSAGRVSAITRDVDTKASDIESKIYSKLQASDCKYTFDEPKGLQEGKMDGSFKMGYSVQGNSCPMNMKFSMETSGNGMSLDMSMLISDEELKKLNDVYGMTLAGKVTVSQSGNSASASGDFKGKILSSKHGEIPVRMSVSGNESGFELSYNVDMPKYSVEVKVAQSKGGKAEYSINGESLTEQEFSELMSKGGPGFTSIGNQGTQSSTSSSTTPSHSPSHSTDLGFGDEESFH